MAATITTLPQPTSYANSPIYIDITTDLISSIHPSVTFTFPNVPLQGETLTIIFGDRTYIFNLKSNPSGTETFALDISPNTVLAFVEQAHARLENNAIINNLFNISHGQTSLTFTWKTTEELSPLGSTTSSATIDEIYSLGPSTKKSLNAYVEIWWRNHNETEEKIATLTAHYINKKTSLIDISEFLQLSAQLPTANTGIGMTAPELALSSFRQFFLRSADAYIQGIIHTPELLHKSDIYTVVHGGYKHAKKQDIDFNELQLLHNSQYYQGNFSPVVHARQPNWIYYWCPVDDSTVHISIEFFYQQTGANPKPSDTATLGDFPSAKGVNIIPSGLHQLTLIDSNFIYSHYEIRIELNGKIIKQRYQIDYIASDLSDVIIFDNGLGGMESLHLAGEHKMTYKTKRNTYTTIDGEDRKYNDEGRTINRSSTGWQHRDYILSLRQLLLGEAYLIKDFSFWKIMITSTSIDLNPTDDFLYAISFTWHLASIDKQHTQY